MRKHLIGVDIGVYLCWFLFRLDISVGICVCFVYVLALFLQFVCSVWAIGECYFRVMWFDAEMIFVLMAFSFYFCC